MKTFTFEVTKTEVYTTQITVDAENEQEAIHLVETDLDECPIDTRSNTFESSDTTIKNIETPETIK